MRATNSIQNDKRIVLSKAEAIETKLQKINRRHGAEGTTGKVDTWLHLVRDLLTQSRMSLNTKGEEEKRSSLPWRNRLSRSNSIDAMPKDDVKLKSLPKRGSYGGSSTLNIIADSEEPDVHVLSQPRSSDADTKRDSLLDTYKDVVVAMRPKSDASAACKTSGRDLKSNKLSAEVRPFSTNKTPRIREDDARANSIESESEASDNSGSNSQAPSVTFNDHPEFISNFREAQSVSVSAPNDVFIDES
ncbi:hypothetical protein DPMN_128669 [Dreissena polymorpha]|uniref:Uncharacterized protein n=2 Tax=Dreissena polymorpha TaxID=45954 RepID=A0A9D4JXM7_DREPO|nr:hypothetical protein DPMN_128669 [Dreissena polymorpha]